MGRKSQTGGVKPKGRNRIEFTIFHNGKRYRPTLERTPSEANLRRARIQLADINRRIAAGSFVFAEEFPDYRYLDELEQENEKQKETCGDIFDRFMAHCSMRVAMNDMAYSTMRGYEKILDAVWRPAIGDEEFEGIVYSRSAEIAAAHTTKKNIQQRGERTPMRFRLWVQGPPREAQSCIGADDAPHPGKGSATG